MVAALGRALYGMGAIGSNLMIWPTVFGVQDEFARFMRNNITWAAPLLILLWAMVTIIMHSETASQKTEYRKKLEGAPVRKSKRRRPPPH